MSGVTTDSVSPLRRSSVGAEPRRPRRPSELAGGGLRVVGAIVHWLRWRWRFSEFGWRSVIRAPALLTGTKQIRIGSRVDIRRGARIEAVGRSEGGRVALSIGDGTRIHLGFHVGAAEHVDIGRNVLIAGNVYVTDHDHALPRPGEPPTLNSALIVRPTRIEDDCWLGEGCMVLKGVHLERGSVVAANAVVTRSFGPYSLVGGVPARLLQRFDHSQGRWVKVSDAGVP